MLTWSALRWSMVFSWSIRTGEEIKLQIKCATGASRSPQEAPVAFDGSLARRAKRCRNTTPGTL
jgi:hypothetical protein